MIPVLVAFFIIMIIGFLWLRFHVVKPIKHITHAFKRASQNPGQFLELDETPKNEFGELAYWYNRRTEELSKAMGSNRPSNIPPTSSR